MSGRLKAPAGRSTCFQAPRSFSATGRGAASTRPFDPPQALCPYIAGRWPHPEHPSSVHNDGIFISIANNRIPLAYGIEALERGDPLAWPSFASESDLRGLPQTVISVNECDPLVDEGISFYRKLLAAGVPARCRQVMGAIHATEVFPACAPDISANTANDIAYLARTGR